MPQNDDQLHLVRPVVPSLFNEGQLSWICISEGAIGGYWKGAYNGIGLYILLPWVHVAWRRGAMCACPECPEFAKMTFSAYQTDPRG